MPAGAVPRHGTPEEALKICNRYFERPRLRQFFTKVDGGNRVNKSICDGVFAHYNLPKPPPFSTITPEFFSTGGCRVIFF